MSLGRTDLRRARPVREVPATAIRNQRGPMGVASLRDALRRDPLVTDVVRRAVGVVGVGDCAGTREAAIVISRPRGARHCDTSVLSPVLLACEHQWLEVVADEARLPGHGGRLRSEASPKFSEAW